MSTNGKLVIVGIGPGAMDEMTIHAQEAIKCADTVVGYKTYIDLIAPLTNGKELMSSGMKKEEERAHAAIAAAREGKCVAVVSSGDPGIYGMAGIVLELLQRDGEDIPVEVVPGVSAASAAAARLGAPLMHDSCFISLSDLLTPWETIEKRLTHAARGDFVVVLYNPKSKGRQWQLGRAVEILLEERDPSTPVGIAASVGREGERIELTTLKEVPQCNVDMTTTVIVGNSQSFATDRFLVTPRGYELSS